jgi:hypothetical protein
MQLREHAIVLSIVVLFAGCSTARDVIPTFNVAQLTQAASTYEGQMRVIGCLIRTQSNEMDLLIAERCDAAVDPTFRDKVIDVGRSVDVKRFETSSSLPRCVQLIGNLTRYRYGKNFVIPSGYLLSHVGEIDNSEIVGSVCP